jgi:hypothetical protein
VKRLLAALVVVTGVIAATTLIVTPANAQLTENCPPGSVQNAAGTTCTDTSTGEIIVNKPLAENPDAFPCPELWEQQGDKCVKVGLPGGDSATPKANATATATSYASATAARAQYAAGTGGALPATGGAPPWIPTGCWHSLAKIPEEEK